MEDGSEKVTDQRACCRLKPDAAMDYRTVIIVLYLLNARTVCGAVPRNRNKPGAVNATVQLMRGDIHTALGHLDKPGLLPNISCQSRNITELVELKQDPLTAQQLSSFRCYMLKMTGQTRELSPQLQTISHYSQQVERAMNNQTALPDCSPPALEDMDNYVFVKCLLELLDQRLSKAAF